MTFMHFDATVAASAIGLYVGWPWTAAPGPYSTIVADDGGNGFQGEALVVVWGEGQGANEGKYFGYEAGFEVINEEWINPTQLAQVSNYYIRLIDLQAFGSGAGTPGTEYSYAGVWSNSRLEWQSLATSPPHNSISANTEYEIGAQAQGEFGDPWFEGHVSGTIELGELNGPTETFEAANVDLGNDEIVLVGHQFETGDEVVYTAGGAAPTPLVDNTVYAVRKVTNDRISLGVTLGDIDATPNFINITFSGTGTGHTFQRIDAVASATIAVDADI